MQANSQSLGSHKCLQQKGAMLLYVYVCMYVYMHFHVSSGCTLVPDNIY